MRILIYIYFNDFSCSQLFGFQLLTPEYKLQGLIQRTAKWWGAVHLTNRVQLNFQADESLKPFADHGAGRQTTRNLSINPNLLLSASFFFLVRDVVGPCWIFFLFSFMMFDIACVPIQQRILWAWWIIQLVIIRHRCYTKQFSRVGLGLFREL